MCYASDAYESICDDLLKWQELLPVVYAVGLHYPNSDASSACASLDKPLWASEDFSSYFQAGGCWARLLNRNYVSANMTSTVAWNLIAASHLISHSCTHAQHMHMQHRRQQHIAAQAQVHGLTVLFSPCADLLLI